MRTLRTRATRRGLTPSETANLARTRDRRRLRFSVSGQPDIERAYRTHWVSPDLSARKAERLRKAAAQPPDLVAVDPLTEWTCAGGATSGEGLLLMQDDQPLCLRCSRLDHLIFLPAGDATRTRRAHRASTLTAIVVHFSRTRKRYERQGLLVEPHALTSATALADRHRIALQAARPGVVLRCGVLGVITRGRRAPTARPGARRRAGTSSGR